MDDIVPLLRHLAENDGWEFAADFRLAADEIERLRTALDLVLVVEATISAHLSELKMDTPEDDALVSRIDAQWQTCMNVARGARRG